MRRTHNERITALEKGAQAAPPLPAPGDPAELKEKLDGIWARLREREIEGERREKLPLEEQLELLRSDRRRELELRARGEGDAQLSSGLMVVNDRVFALSEQDFVDRIAAGT